MDFICKPAFNLPLVNETLRSKNDISFLLGSRVNLRLGMKLLKLDINLSSSSYP